MRAMKYLMSLPPVAFALRVHGRAQRANLGLVAAGVAFAAMFALFPGLAAVVAVASLILDPGQVATQLQQLSGIIPPEAHGLLMARVDALLGAGRTTLTWATALSFAVALWSARAGVSAMVRALNEVHGVRSRAGLHHLGQALALTLVMVIVASTALFLIVFVPIAIAAVQAVVPGVEMPALGFGLLRWGVVVLVMILGLAILYRFGPNAPQQGRWITLGAVGAVAVWLVATYGLSLYLANFGRFHEVYGSIFAVIALMMWLYAAAYLALLGAAFDVERHLL